MLAAFGGPFAAVIPHRLAGDLCTFASPLLLQALLRLIEEGGMAFSKVDAVTLVAGIFVAKSTEMFLVQNYFHHCFRVGWRVRAGVTGLIMKKTLKLSGEGRAKYGMGEVTSLVSIDALRLCVACGYLHYLWASPVQVRQQPATPTSPHPAPRAESTGVRIDSRCETGRAVCASTR